MGKEILINQLFAGKYLDEGENIGHEVINLFRDDEGKQNLFITPSGSVKGHDLEYIIFVRNVAYRRTVEVIGLAKNISCITEEEIKSVRYAGVSLDQIFSNNRYHGELDNFADHITYRAENFFFPSRRIFISLEKNYDVEEYILYLDSQRKVITPQGMREYYSDENDSNAYFELKELVENSDFWNEQNSTEKLFPDGAIHNIFPSFLEVIKKENDENIFSNLLVYFFEYSHRAFKKFAANPNLLDIPNMSLSFDVYRENMNVDIWIESEKDIIIIENKIKSGINGVTREDYSQLNRYYDLAKKKAKNYNKEPHYFIFAPDYAKFDLKQFGLEDVYKVIKYSEIFKFFIEESETFIADRVFPDFLRGLKRHTLTFPELQFETMRSRLLRKINSLQ